MKNKGLHHPHIHRRGGFTTPMVAVALVVAMCGLALMLDRLWLDAADLELTTAAEAAALAAAAELASDDLLKPVADSEIRLDAARSAAALIAAQNLVAGEPVMLNSSPQGDIRLGRIVSGDDSGQLKFEETNESPTSVVVTAVRTRAASNPVGLFVGGLTGQPFGDVATRVEASIDNRIVGVRPLTGAPVPAIPLAIWWKDSTGRRKDTWEQQIELRGGTDNYGYDPVGRRIFNGADGIPEMVLLSQGRGQLPGEVNAMVVDLGTRLRDQELRRQFTSGWTEDDLSQFGGELRVSPDAPESLWASAELRHADREALDTLIGESRICLLYSHGQFDSRRGLTQVNCMKLVAIRVLSVRDLKSGACEVIVQPCVVATRTALLLAEIPSEPDPETVSFTVQPVSNSGTLTTTTSSQANPYIYKLQLTQ